MSELHDYAAPYALNALEPLERLRFERHLDECQQCQVELQGFAATAAKLGVAAARTPPPRLRNAILDAASRTPQQRPQRQPRRRLRSAWPRMIVAAALVFGLAGAGGYLLERNRADEQSSRAETIASVVAARDASTDTEEFTNGGVLRVVRSTERNTAVVLARDLPSPGKGKIYQMWLISDDVEQSAGTVVNSGTMVVDDVDTVDRLAFTVEPSGGSKRPTTEPIIDLEL